MSQDNPSSLLDDESDQDHHRLYSVLNVPRYADTTQIQKNFKILSRLYHPDKTAINDNVDKRVSAQESFVAIKTAADVLSDPVYRVAYDHGGVLAVTLVKRSQTAHHSKKARAAEREGREQEENEDETEDDIDLYRKIEESDNEEDAAFIIHQLLEDYRIHQQHMSKPNFDASCEIPFVYGNNGPTAGALQLQREATSFNVTSRYPLSERYNVTVGVASQVDKTAETNINSTCSLDYQPVRGTHITTDAVWNHKTPSVLSIRTSRQSASGTVIVAAFGGPMINSNKIIKAWNASLISYRTILWNNNSTYKSSQNNDNNGSRHNNQQDSITKLQATWRLSFNPAGQIRFLMASIRNLQYPEWKCRLGLTTYPIKISYRGNETNTFYIAYSLGMSYARIKLLRISSLGQRWTMKYGIKFDGYALYSGNGSVWNIICQFHSSDITIRIPIALVQSSMTPIKWLISLFIADFIDSRVEAIKIKSTTEDYHRSSTNYNDEQRDFLTTKQGDRTNVAFMTYVESVGKKKRLELLKSNNNNSDSLIILHASLIVTNGKNSTSSQQQNDVTDFLQFWVVGGTFQILQNDLRWSWLMPIIENQESLVNNEFDQPNNSISSFWFLPSIITRNRSTVTSAEKRVNKLFSSLTVRYQTNGKVYEILFDGNDNVTIPNENATELGNANQVQ